MSLTALAISVLWFLIGVVVLCGIVWIALYVIKMFVPTLPPRFEQAVWVIVLLLVLIALLSTIAGGPSFRFG
jgi:hypothetical protein